MKKLNVEERVTLMVIGTVIVLIALPLVAWWLHSNHIV